MIEHPQQTDRTLRDTRILTLRIWAVVGCIVIAAVIFNLMGILAPAALSSQPSSLTLWVSWRRLLSFSLSVPSSLL